MNVARHNHYVPQWYQRRFLSLGTHSFHYLNLSPEKKELPDGRTIMLSDSIQWGTEKCFREKDLYTTTFFGFVNDEIERHLFGAIDKTGEQATRAIIDNDFSTLHTLLPKFFEYLAAQKIRTPKGLEWIKANYHGLDQTKLMIEMQAIRQMNCTMWAEAVPEIVSAENSDVKFILTDHPATIYNPACPPSSGHCKYPNDPLVSLKGSQTIFPLDLNHCLILTNLEYAKTPQEVDLLDKRTNARHFGQTIFRIDHIIRSRKLKAEEVNAINYVLKARARKFIAATDKNWLFPETSIRQSWRDLGNILLPPKEEVSHFGGEIYIGYKDGTTYYQDAFGRTTGELTHLKKPMKKGKVGNNDPCPCGSGKKYKKCCRDIPLSGRSQSTEYSIRERNLMFFNAITKILGMNNGMTWDDVRKELTDEQVKRIHGVFEALWPKDSNIVDLLPRPNQKILRALFTGLIDPRTIYENATNFCLYFDEIFIVNPFTNPSYIAPEYNPINSPSQYKQETLKNVFLFLQLIPFIKAGIVNLIPDLCSTNPFLRKQIMSMAQARQNGESHKPAMSEVEDELFRDDFKRSILSMPEEYLRKTILDSSPNLTSDQMESTIQYMKEQRKNDPLSLLQPIIPGENGAQLQIMHLSPNYEMALFLAQITGSIIFTDSPARWEEITKAPELNIQMADSAWAPLTKGLCEMELRFSNDHNLNLAYRLNGTISSLRSALRNINGHVQTEQDSSNKSFLATRLSEELRNAIIKSDGEWSSLKFKDGVHSRKLEFSLPMDGFKDNTIQRLLLASGVSNYLKSVPMAIKIF